MIGRSSTEMDEDEVEFVSEKKLKMEREFAAGPSNGIPLSVVANTSVDSSKPTLTKLSEVVTKKNFNKMILESGILDGKWSCSDSDIVSIIKRDIRFTLVAKEKLAGYKTRPGNMLVRGLKKFLGTQEDEFGLEQRRRESKWKPDVENLNLSKETYQLQPFLDHESIDGYIIETVQAGGTADIVLTNAATQEDPLSWTEKLKLPVYLPIEAKSTFSSMLNGKQRQHTINGLAGHSNCAALISCYQYDSELQPRLFAIVLAKKVKVILRYISESTTFIAYSPTISKMNGMLTRVKWNANMEKIVKDKDVLVRTINDFIADQLEEPGWIIRQFIAWADPASTLTIADFQSDSLTNQKGNVGEELTSILFHSVEGAVSRAGELITFDKVDLWMVKGDVELSISCKTVGTFNGNFMEWGFPLYEKVKGKNKVPVTYERSCDIWTATLHFDLIEPNLSILKPPDGTHLIIFIFTKEQLQDRLGNKSSMYFKPGEHLEKAIYFDADKKILNPETIDRLISQK